MYKSIISLVLLYFVASCQNMSELESKHDEIMKIHDEVMPLLGNIYQLRKNMQSPQIVQDSIVLSSIKQLNHAEESMMDWMANYEKPKEWQEKDKEYLSKQLKEVEALSEIMRNAISESEYVYKTIK